MIAPEAGEVSGGQTDSPFVRSDKESAARPSLEFIRAVAELLETEPDTWLADRQAISSNERRWAEPLLPPGSATEGATEYARRIS
jgi:hypothetical protein